MSEIRVPFQDFRAAYHELKDEFDVAYHRFMESGWFVLGKETIGFEEEYASYCESSHCVGVANGLDALRLALLAIGVGPGDEVIVPSNTYIATWLAVTQIGAIPVPVEPDSATFNINPTLIEESVSSRTKVLLAVNLYGQPCDYFAILEIASKHGIKVVIDNAQAQGARYQGRRVGGIADIECHSFYPSKNLGAYGEAGAITTNDVNLADKVRILRNYGSRVRYHNEVVGYNSRIDELQAAFLRVKLPKLDEWNARRAAVAKQYVEALMLQTQANSSLDTEICKAHNSNLKIVLPQVPDWAEPVWHLFVIRHPERDLLQKHLTEQGIQTIIHYPIPPHRSGAYADAILKIGQSKLPVAEQMANEVLSLPVGPHMPGWHVDAVVAALRNFRS
jgi:dTDP-4-amino-4,6-dideoxygalactose transaminase